MKQSSGLAATLAVFTAGALWGIISIFVRHLQAAGLSSLQVAFCRAFVSFIILGVVLFFADRESLKVKPKDLWIFFGSGCISLTLFNICYFTTIQKSQVSIAVMLLYTSPIFVMLMSRIFFRESLTGRKLLAVAMTFAGCVLVSGVTEGKLVLPLGALIVGVGAGLFYALYSIFGRVALEKYSPQTLTLYTFLFATIGSLPLAKPAGLVDSFTAHPSAILWAVGIGIVCTIIPYLCYSWGLARMEAGKAAVLVTVEPLVGSLVGIFFYGEAHGLLKIIGMALILGASIVLNLPDNKERNDL